MLEDDQKLSYFPKEKGDESLKGIEGIKENPSLDEPCKLENVTLQDIQLCLINADRLYRDSKSVSFPTKVSLIELSLEEVSKCWALLFKYFDKNSIPYDLFIKEIIPNTLSGDDNKINGILSEIKGLLNDPELCDNLKKHNIKIDFIIKLKELFTLLLKFLPNLDITKILSYARKDITENKINLDEAKDYTKEFFNSIKVEKLKELVKVKNEGLYADITPSGHIISPDLLMIDLEPIEIFLGSLLSGLNLNINLLLRLDGDQKIRKTESNPARSNKVTITAQETKKDEKSDNNSDSQK